MTGYCKPIVKHNTHVGSSTNNVETKATTDPLNVDSQRLNFDLNQNVHINKKSK